MNTLAICQTCSGYRPADASCPHCQVAPPRQSRAMRLLKRSLQFVAGSALTVTVAACYGSPCSSDEDCYGSNIDSITVIGGEAVTVGSSLQLAATAMLTDGSFLDVTLTAEWSTDNPGIATVVEGLVTGESPGTAMISATQDGITGFANVTVSTSMSFSLAEVGSGGDGPGAAPSNARSAS